MVKLHGDFWTKHGPQNLENSGRIVGHEWNTSADLVSDVDLMQIPVDQVSIVQQAQRPQVIWDEVVRIEEIGDSLLENRRQ